MKYIELGLGNRWFLRTESELDDGTEYEEKGIVGPIKVQSLYIRIWIGETVFLVDSKEGFKRIKKKRKELKLILGMVSK